MKLDLTITFSVILGCAAVISPVLTALINNRHQRKMRSMDIANEQFQSSIAYQRGCIEQYVQHTAWHLRDRDRESGKAYNLSRGAAMFYVPTDLRDRMLNLHELIRLHDYDNAEETFSALIPDLIEAARAL